MSRPPPTSADTAFRRFVRRVWREDVAPLLRGRLTGQRRTSARLGGSIAGAGGLLMDKVLGLRGRPFARALTVLGSSFGAMLPDVWDWDWLRRRATDSEREAVENRVRIRAAELPEADALELFGLTSSASLDELKKAWRAASRRWHPDRAADESARRECTLRFVALQAAYERLRAAYDRGALPLETPPPRRERQRAR